LKKRLLPVIHLTQYFWPPVGGQELLIVKMCDLAAENNRWSIVVQPLRMNLLLPSTYRAHKLPSKTFLLPLPTLFLLLSSTNKIYNFIFRKYLFSAEVVDWTSWVSFNWSLRILNIISNISLLRFITVIHYHFHQRAFLRHKTIIFSHGVEWQRPPVKKIDVLRSKYLEPALIDPNVVFVIANDNDYIDEIGKIDSASGVLKKVIFLPNPVDLSIFCSQSAKSASQYSYKRVVMVRNVRPDRGVLEGIQAFKIFKSNPIFNNWCLDIYGHYKFNDE
jgi:hypothetical protein